MAEIEVHTAWRWTCPHCGMKRIMVSSDARRRGSECVEDIAVHLRTDHAMRFLFGPGPSAVVILNLNTGVLVG